jgi:hypothetical protein
VIYDSPVMRVRVAIAAAVLLAVARSSAAAVPAGAVVHVDPVIDLAAISRTIASRYDIVVRRAVTADIDRDGDLDVLTASDYGFDVWVNDGSGWLTSQPPRHHAPVTTSAPGDTWRESDSSRPMPIPPHDSSLKMSYRTHAPPAAASRAPSSLDPAVGRHAARGVRTPRAPPLASSREI